MAKPGQPARKLFISDLKCHCRASPVLGDGSNREWVLQKDNEKPQALKFVWLQGVVVQHESADMFVLSDGSGRALIGGCSKIPSACPKPKLGGYFMVIGELKANDDIPAVKAFKIQDLSASEILKQMWTLEVMDVDLYDSSYGCETL